MERAARWGVPLGVYSAWHPALDPRLPDGLADVRERWTFSDLFEFTVMQPALDELHAIAHERAELEAQARARAAGGR